MRPKHKLNYEIDWFYGSRRHMKKTSAWKSWFSRDPRPKVISATISTLIPEGIEIQSALRSV